MKPLYLKLLSGVLLLSIISCSKSNDTDPTPTTPSPTNPTGPTSTIKDTLSAGWTKTIIPGKYFIDIFFANNSVGYVGSQGKLLMSRDGGTHWDSLPGKYSFYNIACTHTGNFFGVSNANSTICTSRNGGPLTEIALGTEPFSDVFAINDDTVYAVTGRGTFWARYNKDSTFKAVGEVSLSGNPTSFYFLNSQVGWMVNAGAVYATKDGGITWERGKKSVYSSSQSLSIFALPSQNVFVGTPDGTIYKSVDSGQNFNKVYQASRQQGNYLDLHFINDNLGYCCYGNRIYKTIDGGITWQQVVVTKEKLVEIHFMDADHGWACGDGGVILRYNQ